ncbi:sulfurtransferase TusA family protein [Elongatibacter sediminis]|uniref:Sulfurtransferase TusA family protein n=1 Tax=Elongatibacter sediminis TaxID=3119006 RepID=A0AAW9RK29_9GAMM
MPPRVVNTSGTRPAPDRRLDARDLDCPQPVIETRKAMRDLQAGQVLEVLSTDPASELDFEAYCRMAGHALIEFEERDGVFRFLLRHSG